MEALQQQVAVAGEELKALELAAHEAAVLAQKQQALEDEAAEAHRKALVDAAAACGVHSDSLATATQVTEQLAAAWRQRPDVEWQTDPLALGAERRFKAAYNRNGCEEVCQQFLPSACNLLRGRVLGNL